MCLSKPNIPTPTPPQEVKTPDAAPLADKARRNRSGAMTGGTLLTGPSGLQPGAASTGRTTLLGG